MADVKVDLEKRTVDIVEDYTGETKITVGSSADAMSTADPPVVITVAAEPAKPRVRTKRTLTAMQLVALAMMLSVDTFGVDEER